MPVVLVWWCGGGADGSGVGDVVWCGGGADGSGVVV